ncbi:MAG: Fe-S cluster assembly protein SufD [Acidobacteriota bacterium]|nr:Fe-S cluster assembly protein SufD [Acidobacteriota bacterium]
MPEPARSDQPFLTGFRQLPPHAEAHGPLWLRRARARALERFHELGLPTTRMEEWRQTSIAPIRDTVFVPVPGAATSPTASELGAVPFGELGLPRLVVVDGRFSLELSTASDLPDGVWAGSLAAALEQQPERLEPHLAQLADASERAFTALNSAMFHDGVVLLVDDGIALERPLHVVYAATSHATPAALFPRTLVVARDGAAVSLVETYLGLTEDAYLTTAVTEVVVGRNARVDHTRVQLEAQAAYHVAEIAARLDRDARYRSLNVCLGASITRNDVGARLDGEGAEAVLNGLYVGLGTQHIDNQTVLDHAVPHCPSHELYKGILSGEARAVFNGRIIVRPDAQKTNAIQSNRNLLLSGDAVVHTRPQLEIHADDVKCTHGATIGRLDEEAMFYVRSRGLDADAARDLLIRAFASDLLDEIAEERLKAELERQVLSRLPRGAASE